MTMNTYARARNDRLSELAEKVAQAVLSQTGIARRLRAKQIKSKEIKCKALPEQGLVIKIDQWRRGD